MYKLKSKIIQEDILIFPAFKRTSLQLQNRRYIGSKQKLVEWIFSIIRSECQNGKIFSDFFAGTGVVSAAASTYYDKIILNDFLYSNYAIYQAFFGYGYWDKEKIYSIINDFNQIDGKDLEENYFSINFGTKYFNKYSSRIIGFIRENIENLKNTLTKKEYYILIASLLYSVDKVANTVGHYETYFKNGARKNGFLLLPIEPIEVNSVEIYRQDANELVYNIESDVVYIDPPYNSRQYSRFYHVLETLTKWDKPKLYGTALKPPLENMSDYCKVSAKYKLDELVSNLKTKYIIVSYNNTYNSKSNSSKNKIALEDIKSILEKRGKTKIFEKDYRHFNAGNTNFNNHKEFLFVTQTENA